MAPFTHDVAPFTHGVWRPLEQVRRVLDGLVSRLCGEVSVFKVDQPTLADPFAILDAATPIPYRQATCPYPVQAKFTRQPAVSLHHIHSDLVTIVS